MPMGPLWSHAVRNGPQGKDSSLGWFWATKWGDWVSKVRHEQMRLSFTPMIELGYVSTTESTEITEISVYDLCAVGVLEGCHVLGGCRS